MEALTIADLITDGGQLLAWPVVIYLFNEVQKLHRQRHEDLKEQRDLFQKVALRVSGGGE